MLKVMIYSINNDNLELLLYASYDCGRFIYLYE